MELIDQIRGVLHLVADLLVWPVFLGLLSAAAITLVTVGATAREAWERRAGKRSLRELQTRRALAEASEEVDRLLAVESVVVRTEREAWTPILRLRLLVRVGPALGLMGTLIPMAYALQGLSEGNLPSLAGNLVTAFAATVIGLAISVLAYLAAALREEWARLELERVTLVAETLLREGDEGDRGE